MAHEYFVIYTHWWWTTACCGCLETHFKIKRNACRSSCRCVLCARRRRPSLHAPLTGLSMSLAGLTNSLAGLTNSLAGLTNSLARLSKSLVCPSLYYEHQRLQSILNYVLKRRNLAAWPFVDISWAFLINNTQPIMDNIRSPTEVSKRSSWCYCLKKNILS